MTTPQSTPIRQAKLGISSTKSLPLANEFKRLLGDQHQRLSLKHQQDLDLIDDIRSYVKARLSIEKGYTCALNKLAKQHSSHIAKKFALLHQLENSGKQTTDEPTGEAQHQQQPGKSSKIRLLGSALGKERQQNHQAGGSSQNSNQTEQQFEVPGKACSLYKVWSEHIQRLQAGSHSRADQFEQLTLVVDKLKDIRSHKAHIGKKCLDTHLKRIHEDLLVSMVELERARKLYYEDENQAKKARENEEKIKKKRSGLLTKFTDLQAKKEKSSAQREANDIQSTQARNDYIMALAAANAHLDYYYQRDLNDFIHLIDDGVLDHCKIFMATLSECDINSLKESLSHAQHWSKLIAITGSQQTNGIFIDCNQSQCLRSVPQALQFEACNNDPISKISLEHNADYALQHEIDKWFTWFKKECRNLSHLVHQLEVCQNALADGKRSIELQGQTIEELEPKVIELKQQIRKSEAAKLKAQARLKVIKEGGMPIEEWSAVESEIAADMARAQEEQERAKRLRELQQAGGGGESSSSAAGAINQHQDQQQRSAGKDLAAIQLQVSRDSDADSAAGAPTPMPADSSMHNLASLNGSTTGYGMAQQRGQQQQQTDQTASSYMALADPTLAWQDDYSAASVWGTGPPDAGSLRPLPQTPGLETVVVTTDESAAQPADLQDDRRGEAKRYDLLGGTDQNNNNNSPGGVVMQNNMSIQSSSPLSAIVQNSNGQNVMGAQSPYDPMGMMSEAYKSDYECDYARTGQQQARSAASDAHRTASTEQSAAQDDQQVVGASASAEAGADASAYEMDNFYVRTLLNRHVLALYAYEKCNEDDLALQEDDLLLVTCVNEDDTNWVRARNLQTGAEGYVHASYVRLAQDENDANFANYDQQQVADLESSPAGDYCRAVYNYQPSETTYDEQDGLPHLALIEGELLRVLDHGQGDGWWLVEKSDGSRGHVNEIMVTELDDDNDDDAEVTGGEDQDEAEVDDQEFADGETNERSFEAGDDITGDFGAPPPNIPPPVLTERELGDQQVDHQPKVQQPPATKLAQDNKLLPATSFVIIEPTPEVESKRFIVDEEQSVESVAAKEQQETSTSSSSNNNKGRPAVGTRHSSAPRSDVSYSIVNEDFVLERPTRKPYSGGALEQHEPTIEEEESLADSKQDEHAKRNEPSLAELAEYQARMPAVSVVIDTVEAIPRSPDESDQENADRDEHNEHRKAVYSDDNYDYDLDDSNDNDKSTTRQNEQQASAKQRATNVDCNPILRHHAEEFSKMIIEEALMLAPGSSIGPSTSSASIDRDNKQMQRFVSQQSSSFSDEN